MSSNHTLSAFDEELQYLMRRITEIGAFAENMCVEAMQALLDADVELAHRVIANDRQLDQAEREIGERAIVTIARRQPVASDLREIVGALRIASDLERVGDLAKNTAKRVIAVEGSGAPRTLSRGIETLANLALAQLREVLDAYAIRSAGMATSIRERDEAIDAAYTSLFRELLTYMMEDPRNITPCTHLLFCAKNFERIGDHATNIAETIIYMVTGHQPEGERPKDDSANLLGAAST